MLRWKRNTFCFVRFLRDAGVIVFLNKQDILKEKIESGKSIASYFPEYKKYRMSRKGEYISVPIWIVYCSLWFTTLDVHVILELTVVVNVSDTVLHKNVPLVYI